MPLEIDIHHTFDTSISALFQQKCQIADEITEWNKTMIGHIQDHTTQQRSLLDQEYAIQLDHLNKLREQTLAEIRVSTEQNTSAALNQLLERCERLKVSLGELACAPRMIQTIQFVREDELIVKQQTSSNPSTSTVEYSEISTTNASNTTGNNLSKSTSSNETQTMWVVKYLHCILILIQTDSSTVK